MNVLVRSLEASVGVGIAMCAAALALRPLIRDPNARYVTSYGAMILTPLLSATMAMLSPSTPSNTLGVDQRWVMAVWFAGLGISLARCVLSLAGAMKLLRRTSRHELPWLAEATERCAKRLGLTRVPEVRVCLDQVSPCIIGVLRPIVLIPTAALCRLTPTQLEGIVAHELAHVKRWDYWANLLQIVVESLLFFHPGVWLLSHLARLDREACCDELAVGVLGNRGAYAEALVQTARLQSPRAVPAFTTGHLASRVLNILGRPGRVRLQIPRLVFGAFVTILLVLTASALSAAPLLLGQVQFDYEGSRLVVNYQAPAGHRPIFKVRNRDGADSVLGLSDGKVTTRSDRGR